MAPGNPCSSGATRAPARMVGCGELPARGPPPAGGLDDAVATVPVCSLGIPGTQHYFCDLLGSPYRDQWGHGHRHLSAPIEFLLEARAVCRAGGDAVSHDPALGFQPLSATATSTQPRAPAGADPASPGTRAPWAAAQSPPGHILRGPCATRTPPCPHPTRSARSRELSPHHHLQRHLGSPVSLGACGSPGLMQCPVPPALPRLALARSS